MKAKAAIAFAAAWVLLLALWLLLRVVFWNGYYAEDAPGYVTDAIYLALGQYHARDYITGLNVGTYLPVALPLAVFGKSEIAIALWPLFCSLLGLLSLAGSASILFGRRFGLLAALLYAAHPGDIFFSTVVMPDAIQAGWLALSVFLIVLACSTAGSRRSWTLCGAGVAMGVCNLVRGNGLLLLPVGAGAVVLLARRWKGESARSILRATAVYLAGWLAVQLGESLAYLWATGDPLHRFHVVNRHYGTADSIARWGLNTDLATIPFSVFPPLEWMRSGGWGLLNQPQSYHAFIFCLALGGLVLAAIAARRAPDAISPRAAAGLALGAVWFAWPLAYHEFGSQSVTHFVPIHRLTRHLVVYAPGAVFAVVAACFAISRAMSTWRSAAATRAVAAIACLVLALHLFFNWQGTVIASGAFGRVKGTYVRVREHLPEGVRTIVGDPGDLCFFDFWLNPLAGTRVQVRPFADYSRCEDLPDGVVLTYTNAGWDGLAAPIIRDTVARLPCLTRPPSDWRLLYDGYPERVFVVGRHTTP